MADHDYPSAVALYEAIVRTDPTDKFAVYNLACARAMAGQIDAAAETFLDSLSLGIVDMFHVERDEHLAPIRGDSRYKAVIANWRKLLDARFDAEIKAMEKAFGPEYTFRRDDERRLGFAAAVDQRDVDAVMQEVRRVWAFSATLFPVESPDPARPDPWVHVILPTPQDFVRYVGGAVHIGGYYARDDKRLVSRDLGPSLRHELFHVEHWRHMDRIGQVHAIWIQEGLASLVEDVEIAPDGSLILQPSWRTNIAKRLGEVNRLMPLAKFSAMTREQFASQKPRATYAQARAWMLFLHERGLLAKWYADYTDHFDQDPTGVASMERTLGAEGREVDKLFRAWLESVPEVAEVDHPGDATLGVALAQGSGAGPVVSEIVASRPGGVGGDRGARLRNKDVILAIDGRSVRTLDDLHRILGEFEVGDTVQVSVRRGAAERVIPVVLVAREPDDLGIR